MYDSTRAVGTYKRYRPADRRKLRTKFLEKKPPLPLEATRRRRKIRRDTTGTTTTTTKRKEEEKPNIMKELSSPKLKNDSLSFETALEEREVLDFPPPKKEEIRSFIHRKPTLAVTHTNKASVFDRPKKSPFIQKKPRRLKMQKFQGLAPLIQGTNNTGPRRRKSLKPENTKTRGFSAIGINFNNPKQKYGAMAAQLEETTTCTKLALLNYYNNVTGKLYLIHDDFETPTPSEDPISAATALNKENLGGGKYDRVDLIARNVPYEYTKSVQSLGEYLCSRFTRQPDKVRAIFVWMTDNISYHGEALMGAESDDTPAGVLINRRSLCEGYSNLFEALCRAGNIECKKVHGFAKGAGFKIGENIFATTNHTWNIVKVNGNWQLVDVTWGAGEVMFINFEKRFTPHYFLPSPKAFIIDHYPEDPTWQLLDPIVSREHFQDLAYCRAKAFDMGLEPLNDYAKQSVSIIDHRITYAFKIAREIDIISLQLTCKSIKGLKIDLKKYATYLLQPKLLFVYVAPPFRGKYELQIFMKDRKDTGFTIPHAMTYQIKVRNSLPFDVGFYSYSNALPNRIKSKINVMRPVQGTLLLHQEVPFRVTTFEEVELVVVCVGWKPPGAYMAGINYSIKTTLQELSSSLYEGTVIMSPPETAMCSNGVLQCAIMVKPNDGLPLPTDEYGWLRYQVAVYDVVPQYSQFDKNYGKTFVLLTKDQEKELKIKAKMEVKDMKDVIDKLSENGAIDKQNHMLGFRLLQPISPFLTLNTGDFCDIQLKTPGGYFISANVMRFSQRNHPALVYYDKDLNTVTTKVFFKRPGRYLFSFSARRFGDEETFTVCRIFIRVNGDTTKDIGKPFLQSESLSNFMILSERWRSYLFNKNYAFEVLVDAKQSFSGLCYAKQKNSKYIQSILMEHPEDNHLRIWRGDLSFPPERPTVNTGAGTKSFLTISSKLLIDDDDVPELTDTSDVNLGDPGARLDVGEHTKKLIHEHTHTYIFSLFVGNEKYQLDVHLCDFSGVDFTRGIHFESKGRTFEIRARARRAGLHRLSIKYRVPDKSGSNRFAVTDGPTYWINFKSGVIL